MSTRQDSGGPEAPTAAMPAMPAMRQAATGELAGTPIDPVPAPARTASVQRATKETRIELELDLDGSGQADIRTGLGFLDHMLQSFTLHARLDLRLVCEGDLEVCDHHTVEDCALALGQAVDEALGQRAGIERFADALVPMDEALARVALDLSGRAGSVIELGLRRETIGQVATENLTHFFQSFAAASRSTLHVDVLRGENDHHRCEAAFKALALSVRRAVRVDVQDSRIPSAKGSL